MNISLCQCLYPGLYPCPCLHPRPHLWRRTRLQICLLHNRLTMGSRMSCIQSSDILCLTPFSIAIPIQLNGTTELPLVPGSSIVDRLASPSSRHLSPVRLISLQDAVTRRELINLIVALYWRTLFSALEGQQIQSELSISLREQRNEVHEIVLDWEWIRQRDDTVRREWLQQQDIRVMAVVYFVMPLCFILISFTLMLLLLCFILISLTLIPFILFMMVFS